MIFKIPAGDPLERRLFCCSDGSFFCFLQKKLLQIRFFRPFSRQLVLYHYKSMGTNCDNGLFEITYSLAL